MATTITLEHHHVHHLLSCHYCICIYKIHFKKNTLKNLRVAINLVDLLH